MYKTTFNIFLLRILGLLSLFISSIFLSTHLTLEEYGKFETLVRLSLFVSTISIFGIDNRINQKEHPSIEDRDNGLSWILIFNSSTLVVLSIFQLLKDGYVAIEFLIVFASIFFSFYRILGAYLLKIKKYFWAVLSDDGISNFLFLFGILSLFSTNQTISLTRISILYFLSRFITLLIFIRKDIKSLRVGTPKVQLLLDSKELFLQTSLQKLSNLLPLIVCSVIFTDKSETGIFGLILRLSSIYMVILSAYNIYLKPKIAIEFQTMKKEFSDEFTKGLYILLLIAGTIFLLNVFLNQTLQSIWPDLKGKYLLTYYIVLLGYLVNLSTGSVGVILNMTGNTNYSIKINILCLICQILVGIGLLYFQSLLLFGIGISLIFMIENILKLIFVRKLLKEA